MIIRRDADFSFRQCSSPRCAAQRGPATEMCECYDPRGGTMRASNDLMNHRTHGLLAWRGWRSISWKFRRFWLTRIISLVTLPSWPSYSHSQYSMRIDLTRKSRLCILILVCCWPCSGWKSRLTWHKKGIAAHSPVARLVQEDKDLGGQYADGAALAH